MWTVDAWVGECMVDAFRFMCPLMCSHKSEGHLGSIIGVGCTHSDHRPISEKFIVMTGSNIVDRIQLHLSRKSVLIFGLDCTNLNTVKRSALLQVVLLCMLVHMLNLYDLFQLNSSYISIMNETNVSISHNYSCSK